MKGYYIIFISLCFISCVQKKKEEIPDFNLIADRNVEIIVNEEIKKALNNLAFTSVIVDHKCHETECGNKMNKGIGNILTKTNFYFNITEHEKDLIIINEIENNCVNNDCFNIVISTEKYTIPINKIKTIDIQEFPSNMGIPIEINVFSLFIDSEYEAQSFKNEYVIARKSNGYDGDITYEKGVKNENLIILEIPSKQAVYLKKSIELLMKEYKNN